MGGRNEAAGDGRSVSGVSMVLVGKVKLLGSFNEPELDPDAVLHGIVVADEWCGFEVESDSEGGHGNESPL